MSVWLSVRISPHPLLGGNGVNVMKGSWFFQNRKREEIMGNKSNI